MALITADTHDNICTVGNIIENPSEESMTSEHVDESYSSDDFVNDFTLSEIVSIPPIKNKKQTARLTVSVNNHVKRFSRK